VTLPVFVAALDAAEIGGTVDIDGPEGHHASTVRRIRASEEVALTDTRGRRATGTVLEAEKGVVKVLLTALEEVPRSKPDITVVQAIPKGDRGELAVQMLTEVGVDTIIPWQAERSVSVWRGDRAAKALAKWRRTAFESSKQARRAHFAEVGDPLTTQQVADLVGGADLGVVLHEEAESPMVGATAPGSGTIVVVVGPEGGISPREIALFGSKNCYRLGDTVLRTSTAGVGAVAALLATTQRWGATAANMGD
jgi:16S rRNA (uracil1498-N3)-methyltransferase